MEHFFSVLKIFIEKHLIPAITSLVLTVASILLFPSLSFIQNKVGLALFWLFIFCCWFLIIHSIKLISKKLSTRNQLAKQYERDLSDNVEVINRLFDSLSLKDREVILTFITYENKPLKIREVDTFSSELYRKEYLFNITSASSDVSAQCDDYWILPDMEAALALGKPLIGSNFRLYKLKNDVFRNFQAIYKHQGKLGNF